ncbi:AAC(3) family N-acetyltransferase [Candidatus Woesearchaeota archaeon]|nr:AAC(3) family N-acetyltransferase [Candidatus Woesearchaeota archaeon]
MDVKQWLVEWFGKNSSVQKDKILEGAKNNYLEEGWIDSFKLISLITEIEENFKMAFTDNDFNSPDFSSIEGLAKIISSKSAKEIKSKAEPKAKVKEAKEKIKPKVKTSDYYKSAPLYKAGNKVVFYNEFVDAIKKLGVKKGDVLFVYSDVSVFGKLATDNKELVMQALVEALKESIGESGTLILPAFSYSFCDKKDFDVEKSPSKVGVLTEYFRKLSDVIRTVQPIYSASIWGKHKQELLKVSDECFGRDSIFGTTHRLGCKLLFLGADFQACTQIHWVEQMHGVPYRYNKTFTGRIIDHGRTYDASASFYVRPLDKEVITVAKKFENYLADKKLLKKAKVGFGTIMMINCKDYYEQGMKKLDEDIHFFLKHPNI